MRDRGEYHKLYMQTKRAERRLLAFQYLGGKCVVCGESDLVVLDFDHIDSDNKSGPIHLMWTMSEEKFFAELDKCQLLCANDHRRKTIRDSDFHRNRFGDFSCKRCGKLFNDRLSLAGHSRWCAFRTNETVS